MGTVAYKGLTELDTTPSGAGGAMFHANFRELADRWAPTSQSFIDVQNPPPTLGLTPLRGDGTEEGANIQAYFDLISSASGSWSPYILMFGPGVYSTAQSLTWQSCEGGRIIGPGMTLQGSTVSSSKSCTAVIRTDATWSGGQTDPILQITGVNNPNIMGMTFDGYDNGLNDVGVQVTWGSSIGTSNGHFTNCHFLRLPKGVHFSGSSGCSNWVWDNCCFNFCDIGYHNVNTQAFYHHMRHCYWRFCLQCLLIEEGGNIYLSDAAATHCNWFLDVGNVGSNNANITCRNLTIDGVSGSCRTKIFRQNEQGLWGGSSTLGRYIGTVEFDKVSPSGTHGNYRGTGGSVATDGGDPKCRLTLEHDNLSANKKTRAAVGEKIRVLGCSDSNYNVVHTITAVVQQAMNAYPAAAPVTQDMIVDTDIAYTADDTITEWVDGEALFTLRGGVFLHVTDGHFDVNTVDYGRLADMQPGNYANGLSSYAHFERCRQLIDDATPAEADIDFDLATQTPTTGIIAHRTGLTSPGTNVSSWVNHYKFTDCYKINTGANSAPWSVSNY